MDVCPICGMGLLEPKAQLAGSDTFFMRCLRCGDYKIAGKFLDRFPLSKQDSLALSRFLRLHHDETGQFYKDILIPSQLNEYIRNGIPKGPIEQINAILIRIMQVTSNLGDYTDVEPICVWAARLGVPSDANVVALATEAKKEGLLEYRRSMNARIALSLTMNGWKKAESLERKPQSTVVHSGNDRNVVHNLYLSDIMLGDFRCFSAIEISFRPPNPQSNTPQHNLTLLLGINGVGKTSILKAIVIGLLRESLRDQGLPPFHSMVRKGSTDSASVELRCLDGEKEVTLESMITKGYTDVPRYLSGETDFVRPRFLVAYGVRRQTAPGYRFDFDRQDKKYSPHIQRVASLFDDEVDLIPLSAWWPKNTDVQAEVAELLKKVVPDELQLLPKLERGDLLVRFRGVELPDTVLSDGYRTFLAWFGDLLCRLTQIRRPDQKLADIPGIVLVDEIDLHLHPSWQQSIIDRITSAFPKLQFIVTTHSPLIVGGVHRESLRVLRFNEDETVSVSIPEEGSYGRTPDHILLSDSFGLKRLRPEAFEKELAEARKKAQSGDIDDAIRYTQLLTLGEDGRGS